MAVPLKKHEILERFVSAWGLNILNLFSYPNFYYKSASAKISILCLKHNILFSQASLSHSKGHVGCEMCFIEKYGYPMNMDTKYFVEQAKNIEGHENYDYTLTKYINATTNILFRCIIHDITITQIPNVHLVTVCPCAKCAVENGYAGGRKLDKDIFIYKANKVWFDLYDYARSIYVDCEKPLEIICNTHGSFWLTPHKHVSGKQGCPYCNMSYNESLINSILKNNDISSIYNFRYCDCKDKNTLPFDFKISNLDIIIEYDGEQHTRAFSTFGGEEALKLIKAHDIIKNDYCMENNITLFRINYKQDTIVEMNYIIWFITFMQEIKKTANSRLP
jgi:hypothetical protein